MSLTIVVTIILGLLASGMTLVAYRGATQANREQAKTAGAAVEAQAYVRAKEIYESALSTLHEEMEPLRTEVTGLRQSNRTLQAEVEKLRQSNRTLQAEVHSLQRELHRR